MSCETSTWAAGASLIGAGISTWFVLYDHRTRIKIIPLLTRKIEGTPHFYSTDIRTLSYNVRRGNYEMLYHDWKLSALIVNNSMFPVRIENIGMTSFLYRAGLFFFTEMFVVSDIPSLRKDGRGQPLFPVLLDSKESVHFGFEIDNATLLSLLEHKRHYIFIRTACLELRRKKATPLLQMLVKRNAHKSQ